MNEETNNLAVKMGRRPHRQFSKENIQIGTRHILKGSTSPAITEMQITAAERYHLTPVRKAVIKRTKDSH